jgi:hypothetical protein
MIRRLDTVRERLDILRNSAIQKGQNTGFKGLDEIYSIKDGSYTFILGSPTHGKSEFIFELLINQMKQGRRSLIYSPETGNVEEIIAELVHKITGKSAYMSNPFHCDEGEYEKALTKIDWFFLIVDSEEKAYSIKELFDMADEHEKTYPGEYINYIMAEPYNEIKHDMATFGTRQDLYIEEFVGEIRRYCKRTKKHTFISLHPASQQSVNSVNGPYYPKPLPREAAGGQALFRKAMAWITIWRPPAGMDNGNGGIHEDNEVLISVDKAKPKGVAVKGESTMFFDWKRNRYYEHFNNTNSYAFEHEKPITTDSPAAGISPNNLFDASIDVDSPF